MNNIDLEEFNMNRKSCSSNDSVQTLTMDFKVKMRTQYDFVGDREIRMNLSNKRNIKFYRKELEREIKTKLNS